MIAARRVAAARGWLAVAWPPFVAYMAVTAVTGTLLGGLLAGAGWPPWARVPVLGTLSLFWVHLASGWIDARAAARRPGR